MGSSHLIVAAFDKCEWPRGGYGRWWFRRETARALQSRNRRPERCRFGIYVREKWKKVPDIDAASASSRPPFCSKFDPLAESSQD
jgi:hypothetical protein